MVLFIWGIQILCSCSSLSATFTCLPLLIEDRCILALKDIPAFFTLSFDETTVTEDESAFFVCEAYEPGIAIGDQTSAPLTVGGMDLTSILHELFNPYHP